MARKDRIDLFGGSVLVSVSFLFGLNQVLVKVVNGGMNPVFQAGLRSALGILPVLLVAWFFRSRLSLKDGSLLPGVITGVFFALEFLLLFKALDYITVGRASVLFYTMPVWLTIAVHFVIPGEHLTWRRVLGLVLAVTGVAVAMWGRGEGDNQLLGDIMCLVGAMLWAGIALTARISPLARSAPEMQLLYQLVVSAIVLLPASLFFGALMRDIQPFHWGILGLQSVFVVVGGFLVWFWMLKNYPASDMASFSFLAPVFGVLLGWLLLGEDLTIWIAVALVLVSAGIVLINRKPKTAMG